MNSFHWFKKRSKRPIRVVCVCMCVRTCRVEPSAFVRGEGLVETHHKKKKVNNPFPEICPGILTF